MTVLIVLGHCDIFFILLADDEAPVDRAQLFGNDIPFGCDLNGGGDKVNGHKYHNESDVGETETVPWGASDCFHCPDERGQNYSYHQHIGRYDEQIVSKFGVPDQRY
jgi:hypothetical protein